MSEQIKWCDTCEDAHEPGQCPWTSIETRARPTAEVADEFIDDLASVLNTILNPKPEAVYPGKIWMCDSNPSNIQFQQQMMAQQMMNSRGTSLGGLGNPFGNIFGRLF